MRGHFIDDNILTGSKHPAFSTNHLADSTETKHNCNQDNTKT